MQEYTLDRLTKILLKIKGSRAELSAKFDAEDAELKQQQVVVENAIKDRLREQGVKGASTEYGNIALRTTTRYYFTDWDAADQFIVDNRMPFLLERRVAQRAMAAYLESNPDNIPPGLQTQSEINVSVTKPRK